MADRKEERELTRLEVADLRAAWDDTLYCPVCHNYGGDHGPRCG